MKSPRLLFSAALLMLVIPVAAQEFAVVNKQAFDFERLRGCSLRIVNGNLYIMDLRSGKVAKVKPNGEQVFSGFPAPRVGRAYRILAATEDEAGNTYVSDGLHIHVYSQNGTYQESLSPDLNIARDGLLALAPGDLRVAGRVPPARGSDPRTLHEIRGGKVTGSFSSAFYPGHTGMEDITLNTDSSLALNRDRGLVYQLPELLYEIRVFRTNGEFVRTIVPPPEYKTRGPNLSGGPEGSGLEPSDALRRIVVLPNGYLAVQGNLLEQTTRPDSTTVTVNYSQFVDLYSADGRFLRRLHQNDLRLGEARFVGIDAQTGLFYFADRSTLYIATLRW